MFEAQEAEAEWILAPSPPAAEVAQLARSFGLDPLVVTVAMQRGFTTPETLERYLYPRLQDLADPFLLPDMEAAVDRLQEHVHDRDCQRGLALAQQFLLAGQGVDLAGLPAGGSLRRRLSGRLFQIG